MRILVTGARGFIGSYLVPALRRHHYVVDPDRLDLDVTDSARLRRFVLNMRPDCIVHLAAATGRDLALDPAHVTAVNVAATGEIARLCGEWDIDFVYTSSSEAYGDHEGADCDEETAPGRVHNLYGLSKLQGEQIASLYCDPLILRPTMPYGPGSRGTSMYPGPGKNALVNFLWAALHEQPITVHRDTVRSWCWVGDFIDAFALLVESRERGVFNVGRDDDPRDMLEVASIAYELAGTRKQVREVDPPSNVTPIKMISTAKLQALGWQPSVSLEDGMQMTLDWLRTLVSESPRARLSLVPR